jgi:hypothetical protein
MELNQAATVELAASAERMTDVATRLCTLLAKMEQQFEALHAKVDRIVAAIDESPTTACTAAAEDGGDGTQKTRPEQQASRATTAQRLVELEKQNAELKAETERTRRKTLSITTAALLAKSGGEEGMPRAALEKALTSLSVEQRIAVKAEMARAGLL